MALHSSSLPKMVFPNSFIQSINVETFKHLNIFEVFEADNFVTGAVQTNDYSTLTIVVIKRKVGYRTLSFIQSNNDIALFHSFITPDHIGFINETILKHVTLFDNNQLNVPEIMYDFIMQQRLRKYESFGAYKDLYHNLTSINDTNYIDNMFDATNNVDMSSIDKEAKSFITDVCMTEHVRTIHNSHSYKSFLSFIKRNSVIHNHIHECLTNQGFVKDTALYKIMYIETVLRNTQTERYNTGLIKRLSVMFDVEDVKQIQTYCPKNHALELYCKQPNVHRVFTPKTIDEAITSMFGDDSIFVRVDPDTKTYNTVVNNVTRTNNDTSLTATQLFVIPTEIPNNNETFYLSVSLNDNNADIRTLNIVSLDNNISNNNFKSYMNCSVGYNDFDGVNYYASKLVEINNLLKAVLF